MRRRRFQGSAGEPKPAERARHGTRRPGGGNAPRRHLAALGLGRLETRRRVEHDGASPEHATEFAERDEPLLSPRMRRLPGLSVNRRAEQAFPARENAGAAARRRPPRAKRELESPTASRIKRRDQVRMTIMLLGSATVRTEDFRRKSHRKMSAKCARNASLKSSAVCANVMFACRPLRVRRACSNRSGGALNATT